MDYKVIDTAAWVEPSPCAPSTVQPASGAHGVTRLPPECSVSHGLADVRGNKRLVQAPARPSAARFSS